MSLDRVDCYEKSKAILEELLVQRVMACPEGNGYDSLLYLHQKYCTGGLGPAEAIQVDIAPLEEGSPRRALRPAPQDEELPDNLTFDGYGLATKLIKPAKEVVRVGDSLFS